MIVALDVNCLIAMASTGAAGADDRARLEHLLNETAASGGKLIIPMPAFAEFLVGIDESSAAWLDGLDRKRFVLIAPFDRRSAFECSLLEKAALGRGDKRGGRKDPWQRIKIDRQIVAIAKVNGATKIISNDEKLRGTATIAGLTARAISELQLPGFAKQRSILDDVD